MCWQTVHGVGKGGSHSPGISREPFQQPWSRHHTSTAGKLSLPSQGMEMTMKKTTATSTRQKITWSTTASARCKGIGRSEQESGNGSPFLRRRVLCHTRHGALWKRPAPLIVPKAPHWGATILAQGKRTKFSCGGSPHPPSRQVHGLECKQSRGNQETPGLLLGETAFNLPSSATATYWTQSLGACQIDRWTRLGSAIRTCSPQNTGRRDEVEKGVRT